jgi:hypothetical protein
MAKPVRKPLSHRERIEANNKGFRAWGVMFGKPEVSELLCTPLPPKRDRLRRPVDGKPVGPTEHQEQATVVSWWELQHQVYELPVIALYAAPNGGARDVITGARLKAEGVRRGTPDLCLATPRGPHHGLYIEMKAQHGGRESDEQRAFQLYLTSAGYRCEFCYGADAAIALIKEYLA